MKAYYFGKMRKCEDLIRSDWFLKLNAAGEEITPVMGKPSFLTKKKFIEDVQKKVENRNQIMAQICRDRIAMKGENEETSEKVEIILPDSDDQHQQGIWSED